VIPNDSVNVIHRRSMRFKFSLRDPVHPISLEQKIRHHLAMNEKMLVIKICRAANPPPHASRLGSPYRSSLQVTTHQRRLDKFLKAVPHDALGTRQPCLIFSQDGEIAAL
jgi:hypothetical protein